MKVPFNVLDRSFFQHQQELEDKAMTILRSGWYVMGSELRTFEADFARFCNSAYCVGLGNGLDALWIAFHLLGIGEGDEVIVQSNAYIACVMGITMNGATPVFVEPDEYFNLSVNNIEDAITDKTKAVLVVHLYGQAANMREIMRIARSHNLKVVEDCAQAHGATFDSQSVGTFGDVGCFSFYPSKNLGCFGDGGAIVTDCSVLADQFRVFRNYGSEKRYHNKIVGTNSRLDELQAGLLGVKVKYLPESNGEREALAKRYTVGINHPKIELPQVLDESTHVWHLYVIRTQYRNELQDYLSAKGIATVIHYPIPPHLSEAYQYLGYATDSFPKAELYSEQILSLPLFNGMTYDEQSYVIDAINDWEI